MFSPSWSVSNHNFYMGMQKLEDRSDGFLNFPIYGRICLPYMEAIQSQCLPPTRYGGARNVDDLYRTDASAWYNYVLFYMWAGLFFCLVCGSFLSANSTNSPPTSPSPSPPQKKNPTRTGVRIPATPTTGVCVCVSAMFLKIAAWWLSLEDRLS